MNKTAKPETVSMALLPHVVQKIAPAILEIEQRKDSGNLLIEFHEGKYQRAKHTRTI